MPTRVLRMRILLLCNIRPNMRYKMHEISFAGCSDITQWSADTHQ